MALDEQSVITGMFSTSAPAGYERGHFAVESRPTESGLGIGQREDPAASQLRELDLD